MVQRRIDVPDRYAPVTVGNTLQQIAGICGLQSGQRHTFGIAGLDQDRGCALRRRFWGFLSRGHLIHSIATLCDSGKLAFSSYFPPQTEILGFLRGGFINLASHFDPRRGEPIVRRAATNHATTSGLPSAMMACR
jgi:hypothetical protein